MLHFVLIQMILYWYFVFVFECSVRPPLLGVNHYVMYGVYKPRLPPPAPRRSLVISLTGCKGHTAPSCTTALPIISYMGWPRGTNFSQLPCAAISTVDHPLGSTSLYTGSWCQTAPSCTTSLTIWPSIRCSLHPPAPHVSPYIESYTGCGSKTACCNTSLRIISYTFV